MAILQDTRPFLLNPIIPCNESLPLSPGPNNVFRQTQVDDLSQVTLKKFLKDKTISQQIMTHLHSHVPLHGVAAFARAAM